jgi:hypothetical protein
VHSAEGFAVGQKVSIDVGGNTEIATVTSIGKAATQTTLAASTTPGATNIKLTALADVSAGDTLTIGTGQRMERAVVASVGTAGPEGAGVTLTAPLKLPHTSGVDVGAGAPAFPSRLPRALPIAVAIRCRRWAAAWCSTGRWRVPMRTARR